MIEISQLPLVNATLNAISGVLLLAGYVLIRRRNISAHKFCMLTAFLVSTLFLISYFTYHYHVGSVPFAGTGWLRPIYYTILIPHVILAPFIIPLALVTIYRAWRGQWEKHKRIARWTLPLWLYGSVTGVIVYWMLYHLRLELS